MTLQTSVVIATRDRGPAVRATIESLLAGGVDVEVNIVDQSRDASTFEAIQSYLKPPAVNYYSSPARGLAAARNLGIQHAHGEFIAMTDDDCQVASNWLRELRLAFDVDRRIGIVFGNVVAAAHDPHSSFIPAYERRGTVLATSLAAKHKVEGIGACMAVRRGLWSQLGGFDPMLGAGSEFRSAEELDFVLRALASGHAVYETDRAIVVHCGQRLLERKPVLAYDYCFGIGATYAKHLKCGRLDVLQALVPLACRWMFGAPVVSFGTPPDRSVRLRGFLKGAWAGAGATVNRRALLYKPPPASQAVKVLA